MGGDYGVRRFCPGKAGKTEDAEGCFRTGYVAVAWTGQQLYQQRGEQENASFYAVLLLYLRITGRNTTGIFR